MVFTSNSSSRRPPGPGRFIPASDLQALRESPLAALVKVAGRYGDFFQYPVGFWTIYVANHPDAVRHILQENHRNYTKATFQYRLLAQVAGNGLLSSDGSFWRRQRRLAQPAFHRESLAALGKVMVEAAENMVQRWQPFAEQGEVFDVDQEMMVVALEIVGKALFGTSFTDRADSITRAVHIALDEIVYRARTPIALPLSVPTPRARRFRRAVKTLDAAVYAIVEQRRQDGTWHHDLLSMLLAARDEETGEGMSNAQLRDEMVTLIVAGHETVASALTWAWYFLAQHPDAERRLHDELAAVLCGRTPTVQDLPALSYTRMVVEETLRLYPPAWLITRRALEADEIGDYRIPAGALIVVSPYLTHRHPSFWENPGRFEPERFAPERSERPRFAYFPFGGGPRLCIGNNFALMEAHLVLAMVAQRYRLELAGNGPVEVVPGVTLRPRGGLPVRLHPRG
jgi:cytochrome P450